MNQFLHNSSKILKGVYKNPENSNYPIPSMSAAPLLGPSLVHADMTLSTFLRPYVRSFDFC